ncbi:MAG: hypothetical protein ABH816_01265 [Candidatus Levyibacteriota bacterium]
MRKNIFTLALFSFFSFYFLFFKVPTTYAKLPVDITVAQNPDPVFANAGGDLILTFTSKTPVFTTTQDRSFKVWPPGRNPNNNNEAMIATFKVTRVDNYVVTTIIPIIANSTWTTQGEWNYKLWVGKSMSDLADNTLLYEGTYTMFPPCINASKQYCPALVMDGPLIFEGGAQVPLYIRNIEANRYYTVWFDGDPVQFSAKPSGYFTDIHGYSSTWTTSIKIPPFDKDRTHRTLCLTFGGTFLGNVSSLGLSCFFSLPIEIAAIAPPTPSVSITPVQSNPIGSPITPWVNPTSRPNGPLPTPVCAENSLTTTTCAKINTGIGDIQTNPAEFVKSLFGIILSLAGGIALILIIISGYKLMVSQGNPEKVKEAQESLTSAIVGLLFIIFSLVILQIIGVDFLKIPGFSN